MGKHTVVMKPRSSDHPLSQFQMFNNVEEVIYNKLYSIKPCVDINYDTILADFLNKEQLLDFCDHILNEFGIDLYKNKYICKYNPNVLTLKNFIVRKVGIDYFTIDNGDIPPEWCSPQEIIVKEIGTGRFYIVMSEQEYPTGDYEVVEDLNKYGDYLMYHRNGIDGKYVGHEDVVKLECEVLGRFSRFYNTNVIQAYSMLVELKRIVENNKSVTKYTPQEIESTYKNLWLDTFNNCTKIYEPWKY